MQQITFENWKQLNLKVGDPILIIDNWYDVKFETTICVITDDTTTNKVDYSPIKFSTEYGYDNWRWIDFDGDDYVYYSLKSSEVNLDELFDGNPMWYSPDLKGYYYIPESNSIRSDNVSPSKILKHSTNQNGERVWKLRKTWVTDTQIKNALTPVAQEVPAKRWMIVGTENGLQTTMTQTVFTELETLKQEMQTILLKNPLIKLTAVELTGIQVSLDLSNPVFKWE